MFVDRSTVAWREISNLSAPPDVLSQAMCLPISNIKYTCPEFSGYVNNLYRGDAELFVAGSDETVMSCEGTTQGGTESMGFYSGGLVPISHYQIEEQDQDKSPEDTDFAKKLFHADDGAGGGTLSQILEWWSEIQTRGPIFGYFPKPSKTWLIVKPEYLERAKELFADSDINITDQGHKYLGSYIGSDGGKAEFVKSQVEEWIINVMFMTLMLMFMECQRSGVLLLGLLLTYQNI